LLHLEELFDCDAISSAANPLDGSIGYVGLNNRGSFPAEDLPPGGAVVEVEGVPFRFPPKDDGLCNSLELQDQQIEVPRGRYRRLWVLGVSIALPFREAIRLIHADGDAEAPFALTDWLSPRPQFGEVVAFQCSRWHFQGRLIGEYKPIIWMQRIDLDSTWLITSLQMPNNPALRVFALTMEQA